MNDNKLHQQLCQTFHVDYLQEMDIILKIRARIEKKINDTLLPNKGLVTCTRKNMNDNSRDVQKRAILVLAITQGTAAIGGMLIKGMNAIVHAKRASSFNNVIKMLNTNVQITHNRLVTLENRTSMMAKAIMPALQDLKMKLNNTNQQLTSQYRMMSSARNSYNLLFRQTHETQMIHHLALL